MKKINIAVWIVCLLVLLTIQLRFYNTPLFTDGANHAYIVHYISEKGNLPYSDVVGNNFNLYNTKMSYEQIPFMQQPLFYVLVSNLNLFINDEKLCLTIVLILSLIMASICLVIIVREYSKFLISLSILLFSFVSINYWLLIHRIMEPVIIFVILLIIYFIIKINANNSKENFKYVILIILMNVTLLTMKLNTVYILLIFDIYCCYKLKRLNNLKKFISQFAYIILVFTLLIIPLGIYSIKATGTIYPYGVNSISNMTIFRPWWNQDYQIWEKDLENESNFTEIKKELNEDYYDAQPSLKNLIVEEKYPIIAGVFVPFPIAKGISSYYALESSEVYKFFALFLFFGIVSLLIYNRNLALFFVLLVVATLCFWFFTNTGTVRYFIYTTYIFIILFLFAFLFFLKYTPKIIVFIFFFLVIALSLNLALEVKRDLAYENSYLHQYAGDNCLYFVSQLSTLNLSGNIFSQATEVAYYTNKQIVWDTRLFFIPLEKINDYMQIYNISYIIIPSYSGVKKRPQWTYVDGIPAESDFNKYLAKQRYIEFGCMKIYKLD